MNGVSPGQHQTRLRETRGPRRCGDNSRGGGSVNPKQIRGWLPRAVGDARFGSPRGCSFRSYSASVSVQEVERPARVALGGDGHARHGAEPQEEDKRRWTDEVGVGARGRCSVGLQVIAVSFPHGRMTTTRTDSGRARGSATCERNDDQLESAAGDANVRKQPPRPPRFRSSLRVTSGAVLPYSRTAATRASLRRWRGTRMAGRPRATCMPARAGSSRRPSAWTRRAVPARRQLWPLPVGTLRCGYA